MRILLVEDDYKLGQVTKELLEYENCLVDWEQTGTDALSCFKHNDGAYDIIILDWMLPEMDGIEVCRILRGSYGFQGGILFVTAKGEEEDCVKALETGADDYVIKPFRIKELMARVHAIYRRKNKPYIDKVYRNGDFALNRDLKTVSFKGCELVLRKKEFELFEMLFVNLNHIMPREAIFNKLWEDKPDTNMESLDSHIYGLRKKLKDVFPQIRIVLVKNVGYKMEIAND
ncbi:MAG: response regulator transcription factor [Alphaproteobacteria bacterium]|nr:response regulator transcription factor [Alphaproteobacteria bacterium]MBR1756338.1 response regulator transcription factor [Alphaproteobacteria bacterium]